MIENFLLVAKQVAILFLLIGVGAVCNRLKLLRKEAIPSIVDFVLLIVTPCLIIEAFQRDFDSKMFAGLAETLFIAVAFHVLSIFLAKGFVRAKDPCAERVLRFSVIFPNAGFMSMPLQQAILGADGVFYGAAIIAVFNLIVWSYGLILMGGKGTHLKIRQALINPGTVGLSVGLVFFLCSFHLPPVISEGVHSLANLNTPMAMIVIGYYLAEADLRSIFRSAAGYVMLFLRLIVVPLIVIGMIWALGWKNEKLAIACVIASSAPVAAITTMFASKYKQDTSISVSSVSVSTLFSLLTMPLMIGFAQWFFQNVVK